MVWLHQDQETHAVPSAQPTLRESPELGGQEWQLTQALTGFQRVVEEQRQQASSSAEELKHKVQRLSENLDSRLEEQESEAQKRHFQVTKLLGELGSCQRGEGTSSCASLGKQLEGLKRDLQELSDGLREQLDSLREVVATKTSSQKGKRSVFSRPGTATSLLASSERDVNGVNGTNSVWQEESQPSQAETPRKERGYHVSKTHAFNARTRKLGSHGDVTQMDHFAGHHGDSDTKLSKSWKVQAELHISALQQVQGWYKSKSKFTNSEEPGGLAAYKPAVETVSSLVIVLNLLYMGVEVEFRLGHALDHDPNPWWLFYVELCFACCFTFELLFRAAIEKWDFIYGKSRRWNLCDTILVVVQVADLSLSFINLSFLRSLRSLRSLQAIRIIRTITWVRELRLMIASIGAALTPLMWSFLLLLLVLYLFALCLAQTVQIYLVTSDGTNIHGELPRLYGSLGQTMVTLFMAISGGRDWKTLLEPLQQISQAYTLFFMVYVTFVLFGMLNILTAIFVESTKMIAEVDSELAIQEHLERENSVINKVRSFLQRNANADGRISREDFEAKLVNPRFQAQLTMLDIDVHEAEGVFKIMNVYESDEVNIEEFIYGLVRLKGNAKAVDIISMMYESRRIAKRLTAFMNYTDASFQDLREDLGLPREPGSGSDYDEPELREDSAKRRTSL